MEGNKRDSVRVTVQYLNVESGGQKKKEVIELSIFYL